MIFSSIVQQEISSYFNTVALRGPSPFGKKDDQENLSHTNQAIIQQHTSASGRDVTPEMGGEVFNAYIRKTIAEASAERNTVNTGYVFPEFEGTHPKVIAIQKFFEYIFIQLESRPVESWQSVIMELVANIHKGSTSMDPVLREYFSTVGGNLREILPSIEEEFTHVMDLLADGDKDGAYLDAFELVKELGRHLTVLVEPKQVEEVFMGLNELMAMKYVGDHLRFETDHQSQWLVIDFSYLNDSYVYRIPLLHEVYYKGGVSRILLKLVALSEIDENDPIRTSLLKNLHAEFPLNDFDMCLGREAAINQVMELTGEKDISGYDRYRKGFDINKFLRDRDCSINSAILSGRGLHFSTVGLESAKTGNSFSMKSDQGIFGDDAIRRESVDYATTRTLERGTKFLIEGKITTMEVLRGDLKIHMGISTLCSACRWLKKDKNAQVGELSPYYFFRQQILLKKLGQYHTYRDELTRYTFDNPEIAEFPDILRYLDMLHSKFPFFDLQMQSDPQGILLWGVRKVMTRLVKDFKHEYGFTVPLNFHPRESDTEVIKFDLDQSMPDEESEMATKRAIAEFLPVFIERAKERYAQYEHGREEYKNGLNVDQLWEDVMNRMSAA